MPIDAHRCRGMDCRHGRAGRRSSSSREAAGVSVATVDRVLNKRAHVRAKTAKPVHEAALRDRLPCLRPDRPADSRGTARIPARLPAARAPARPSMANSRANSRCAVAEAADFRGVCHRRARKPDEHPTRSPPSCIELAARCHGGRRRRARASCRHRGGRRRWKSNGVPVFVAALRFRRRRAPGLCRRPQRQGRAHRAWMIANCARSPARSRCSSAATAFTATRRARWAFAPTSARMHRTWPCSTRCVNFEDAAVHPRRAARPQPQASRPRRLLRRRRRHGRRDCPRCGSFRPKAAGHDLQRADGASRAPRLADKVITMVISTPVRAISQELVKLMARIAVREGIGQGRGLFLPFDIYLPESV